MINGKDPAIKLFGRTIPVVEQRDLAAASADDSAGKIAVESKGRSKAPVSEDQTEPGLPSVLTIVDSKEDERETEKEDERETEKTLKRPEKILPCPRCNSLDTKFCYYNNYNVNQPRHFCKNCQRYWTAGGTMRNVPVGAGRRRGKPSPPPPPEPVSKMFPSWDLERESSESGSSFPQIGPPWIKESPILPSSTSPRCSLERESPHFYMGSAPLTLSSWVNHPDAPGSSSSLGKHSRENTGSEKISSLPLKTVRVNDSRGASTGSTQWVKPDAAEDTEKRVNF